MIVNNMQTQEAVVEVIGAGGSGSGSKENENLH